MDDDPGIREVVAAFLGRVDEDLEVESVESAATALDRLADERFDCLLSDHEMPGMDGLTFLARVRERHPRLPFVLYTGRDDEEMVAAALACGVDDYVRKGTDRAHYTTLGVRIRRVVERARVERELARRTAALEAVSEGVCILDGEGVVRYANAVYLDRYGDDAEKVVGESWQRPDAESETDLVVAEVLPTDESAESRDERDGRRSGDAAREEPRPVVAVPDGGLVIVDTEYGT